MIKKSTSSVNSNINNTIDLYLSRLISTQSREMRSKALKKQLGIGNSLYSQGSASLPFNSKQECFHTIYDVNKLIIPNNKYGDTKKLLSTKLHRNIAKTKAQSYLNFCSSIHYHSRNASQGSKFIRSNLS